MIYKAHESPGLHRAADSLVIRDKGNKNWNEMLMAVSAMEKSKLKTGRQSYGRRDSL